MKVSKITGLVLGICAWLATSTGAATIESTDGVKFTGDIVQKTPAFIQLRVDSGYTNLDWSKISQDSLKELQTLAASSRDQKLAEYVAPYIEVPEEEIIKKTQVEIKPAPRLERPEKGSLIGAMFKSSVGLVCLLLLYAANIYAAYEIAVIRAYPPAMVCGIAAVAPIVGPIVFLCFKTRLPSHAGEEEEELDAPAAAAGAALPSASHGEAAAPAEHGATASPTAASHAAAPALPQTQVYKRGQFTFNRRFIETKFSAFFTAVRRGDDKDMVLVVKSVRGEFVATRISRIAGNDMHLEVHKGGASQEVQMPFLEIQEIQLKHKDA
ncbi:MAG: hypothetical protein QM813_18230 [Verrucomicrobiota bacterium]